MSELDLPEVKGAILVKPIPIDLNNSLDASAQDIFIRLVSMKAHEISSLYSEEKARLIRQTTEEINEKNNQLDSFLDAIEINKLYLDNSDYLKLPKKLLECCASLNTQPNLIKSDIPNAMKQIVAISMTSKDLLDEIEELIEKENGKNSFETNENDMNRKARLKLITCDYNQLLKNYNEAFATNMTLRNEFENVIDKLKTLSLPLSELSNKLPKIEESNDEEVKQIKEKLLKLVNKVNEMKEQREQLMNRLKASMADDDPTKAIASRESEVVSEPTAFFKEQLKKHDQLIIYLKQNLQAQDNILKAVTEAYALFTDEKNRISESLKKREDHINELIEASNKANSLIEKAKMGVKFYERFIESLNKLKQALS